MGPIGCKYFAYKIGQNKMTKKSDRNRELMNSSKNTLRYEK